MPNFSTAASSSWGLGVAQEMERRGRHRPPAKSRRSADLLDQQGHEAPTAEDAQSEPRWNRATTKAGDHMALGLGSQLARTRSTTPNQCCGAKEFRERLMTATGVRCCSAPTDSIMLLAAQLLAVELLAAGALPIEKSLQTLQGPCESGAHLSLHRARQGSGQFWA